MVASYVNVLITSVPEQLISHLTLTDVWTDSLPVGTAQPAEQPTLIEDPVLPVERPAPMLQRSTRNVRPPSYYGHEQTSLREGSVVS